MRHILVRAVILLALLGGTRLAFALSSGPVAARTGAFAVANKAAESNCTLCHTPNPLNSGNGYLRILGVPAQYAPGQTYNLRVEIQHTWSPEPPDPVRWGFQLQAVQKSTGDSAGIWVLGPNAPPDTFKIVKTSGTSVYRNRRYIEHTRNLTTDVGSNHTGEWGPITWNLRWQAPPGDSGKIYFFAAGNAANGDLLSLGSGDWIYTTAESTVSGGNVDVPSHPSPLDLVNALDEPYPNPMAKCTNIDFTISRAGSVDLAVFDIHGRRVRTILRDYRPPGTHAAFWDGREDGGRYARNGVYFIRLRPPGGAATQSRKVMLAR